MKIGIIGPIDSIEKILKIKNEFSNEIIFNTYPTNTIEDAKDNFLNNYSENDGILFTGPAVYNIVYNTIPNNAFLDIPTNFVPYDETSLVSLYLENPKIDFKNVSIDILKKSFIKNISEKINLENFFTLPYDSTLLEKNYIDFHEENLNTGKANKVLTCFSSIYTYFKNKNIPVYRLFTTDFSIRNSVNTLILDIKNHQLDLTKVSTQIIKLDFDKKINNNLDILEKVSTFQKDIIPYIKSIKGAIFQNGHNEFIIFSNKGFILSKESKEEFFKVLSKFDYNIYSGIGIGNSYLEAELNATKAFNFSTSENKSSLFLNDEYSNISEISLDDLYASQESPNNKEILNKIATEHDINIKYLLRLVIVMNTYKTDTFTSKTLGSFLDISDQTSRRLLQKLLQCNLGTIIGKEGFSSAGRPLNLVKINFNKS